MLSKIKNNKFFKTLNRGSESNLIIILIVLILGLWLLNPKFLSVLRQTAIIGVLAIGMTFVILAGGIDLSVGSVLAFSSVIASKSMVSGLPIWLSILIALLSGSLIGAIMGLLIHYGKVPAFIATLGGMTIVRALVMLVTGAEKVLGLPDAIGDFAINRYLTFGRNMYAIGSNEEAARLSGIKIGFSVCGIYAFSALMASVAGILMTARLCSGVPTAGQGYELDAIAAVVVGGASLTGAVGSIAGTVLGTVIIATIKNGGTLLGINFFILDILIGSLIVIAVLIDQLRKNKSK